MQRAFLYVQHLKDYSNMGNKQRMCSMFRWYAIVCCVIIRAELARQLLRSQERGGKSGLHRAGYQVTPGRCKPTTSAAERRPPTSVGKGERVR